MLQWKLTIRVLKKELDPTIIPCMYVRVAPDFLFPRQSFSSAESAIQWLQVLVYPLMQECSDVIWQYPWYVHIPVRPPSRIVIHKGHKPYQQRLQAESMLLDTLSHPLYIQYTFIVYTWSVFCGSALSQCMHQWIKMHQLLLILLIYTENDLYCGYSEHSMHAYIYNYTNLTVVCVCMRAWVSDLRVGDHRKLLDLRRKSCLSLQRCTWMLQK